MSTKHRKNLSDYSIFTVIFVNVPPTRTIAREMFLAKLLVNRSACFSKLLKATKDVRDAERAIELFPEFHRAYFRLGVAFEEFLKRLDAGGMKEL